MAVVWRQWFSWHHLIWVSIDRAWWVELENRCPTPFWNPRWQTGFQDGSRMMTMMPLKSCNMCDYRSGLMRELENRCLTPLRNPRWQTGFQDGGRMTTIMLLKPCNMGVYRSDLMSRTWKSMPDAILESKIVDQIPKWQPYDDNDAH